MERSRANTDSLLSNTRNYAKSSNALLIPRTASIDPRIPRNSVADLGKSSQLSVALSQEEGLHLPRALSKSAGANPYLISSTRGILNLNLYVLQRSKSSYSIPLNAFLSSEKSVKSYFSMSMVDFTDNSIDNGQNETVSASSPETMMNEEVLVKEDGFLRDIEMKGFSGFIAHPITR
jgi:hypothetical protein